MEFFVAYVQPWLPDTAVRWITWAYLTHFVRRLRRLDHPFKELRIVKRILFAAKDEDKVSHLGEKGFGKVAEKTAAANEQHYEVPTEFFLTHLGPCRKYSSCEWANAATLAEAETQTFDSYLEKMGLNEAIEKHRGGLMGSTRPRVLEIGCGWGSFLLYAAQKYPGVDFVGFSNSSTQIIFINEQARDVLKLTNVKAVKLDINDFCDTEKRRHITEIGGSAKFDRIISIECLEHSRNYAIAFKAMREVLRADGSAFVQVLCHREYTYFMNDDDWMGRNFFTGGTIPSTKFFQFFNEDLRVRDTWYLSGKEYARTLDAWLHQLESKKAEVKEIFKTKGYANPTLEYEKWRMFYLMSSESFGYGKGNEWMVAYYRLDPIQAS